MAALFPLMVFWSTKYNDNAVVATAASIASLDASFAYYATDLGVVSNTSAAPGADVPLNFYFNPATGHHMTTASAAGNAYAKANGFVFQRVEGWVSSTGATGAVPMTMWYSAQRDDHFLIGTAQNAGNAQGAGYVVQYVDCYVPAPPVTWTLWPDSAPAGIIFPKSADLLTFEYDLNGNAVPPGIGADTCVKASRRVYAERARAYPAAARPLHECPAAAQQPLTCSPAPPAACARAPRCAPPAARAGGIRAGPQTAICTARGRTAASTATAAAAAGTARRRALRPCSATTPSRSRSRTFPCTPSRPTRTRGASEGRGADAADRQTRRRRGSAPPSHSPLFRTRSVPSLRSPSLNFHHGGVWYYGTYSLENYGAWPSPAPNCGNWCECYAAPPRGARARARGPDRNPRRLRAL